MQKIQIKKKESQFTYQKRMQEKPITIEITSEGDLKTEDPST